MAHCVDPAMHYTYIQVCGCDARLDRLDAEREGRETPADLAGLLHEAGIGCPRSKYIGTHSAKHEADAARLHAAGVRVTGAGLREALDKYPWVWDTLPNDVQEAINATLATSSKDADRG